MRPTLCMVAPGEARPAASSGGEAAGTSCHEWWQERPTPRALTSLGLRHFRVRQIGRSMPSIEFSEHHIPRGDGRIYARDYAGAGPAFVLMHGFPDNLKIYDHLVPYLVAGGRRVVTFDFLGFGASDKPAGAAYSFNQQLGDLEAVVQGLSLGKIVPVAHDASGIATLNYALAHPAGVDSVIMLNSAYAEDDTALWPEMITLFATKSLQALAMSIAQSPEQFGWLLTW